MGFIKISDLDKLGYGFIPTESLAQGQDEYYLRFSQNPRKDYRHLNNEEIAILEKHGNFSENWNEVLVADPFDVRLVRGSRFYGLVRIGKTERMCLGYNNLNLPSGIYDSVVISCDLGDNVAMHNVRYISHYIVGERTILFNIDEIGASPASKLGNVLHNGKSTPSNLWLEVGNENGGRSILAFDGMLCSDAWIWSKYRDDETLMKRLVELTYKKHPNTVGYYGVIGQECVIKNSKSIKDVNIGECCYIKGANKLKRLIINSNAESPTQIGEGVELVNGIVGYGCKVFYGVKAIKFVLCDHSSLKYGARLLNSVLGENSTISCCEVLNSLIYPSHEQHHNNSFLIASTLMGQSNVAAGATIGSNHNSRASDGEIVLKRGFWAGLSSSVKHNSRFASFILLAKSSYRHSLDVPLPFSLVSNNEKADMLEVLPAYWWLYNMYALERNSHKFKTRDARKVRYQHIEFEYLAPDSVCEIMDALKILDGWWEKYGAANPYTDEDFLLVKNSGLESSGRDLLLRRPKKSYQAYRDMLLHYVAKTYIEFLKQPGNSQNDIRELAHETPKLHWLNIGGQIVPQSFIEHLKAEIRSQKIDSWEQVHEAYRHESDNYLRHKVILANHVMSEIFGQPVNEQDIFHYISQENKRIALYIRDSIRSSREKDYQDPFRSMVYDSPQEMKEVLGDFNDNDFIRLSEGTYRSFLDDLGLLN